MQRSSEVAWGILRYAICKQLRRKFGTQLMAHLPHDHLRESTSTTSISSLSQSSVLIKEKKEHLKALWSFVR